jgi:EAL domain-containing protein (putative c-di-GMP-specific phosphodiesterase class I)
MEVVAEGVETAAQLEALRIAGCSHMQGYYLSRPVDAEDALVLAGQGSLAPQPEYEASGTGTHG